ncbi:extracellular matrix glycoprotein pherophorin-V12 [Volvox carteri f. nagariensis]|uniref:Extracellular matrix glycoprotein pherophorin-V12 n=1 Tax=Volvox carteri f. nagariensis TaxID=3068 RepID=D8TTQ1_VOLCA|nr:extracellular matrix glycoprotein pherophorin-V12 [Volvox carteri f. nagariensis]EFJ49348.1 extracellular matrix glycoprotein pherophorin-V12 [Volvox carteri f. nagariensis]|eukprot:XP_002949796.1 extracellular matrix glycoprotein pherophorin-V12 [Volvox carteri f. nagariensis]
MGEQTGSIPQFPFHMCAAKTGAVGAYSFAPVVEAKGGGKYCFTIKVLQGCSSPCCTVNLHKIEFNVSTSCLVQPAAEVKATINGVYTRIGPSFDRPLNGQNGSAILRLTQLALDAVTAANAELCITLKANRGGQGCTTLEQMCVTPPGAQAGVCVAAMFDTTRTCCPISQTLPSITPLLVNPPPPSPQPPPPSPQPPSPPPPSPPPPSPPPPSPFTLDTCGAIQQRISTTLNAAIAATGMTMFSEFEPDWARCSELEVGTCGTFNSPETAQVLVNVTQDLMPGWIAEAAGGDLCSTELDGYKITVTTNDDSCVFFTSTSSCAKTYAPFPTLTCNKTQGVLPFAIDPRYYPLPDQPGKTTSDLCFMVKTLSPEQIVPASCGQTGDNLARIEWHAFQNMSSTIKSISLYPRTGNVVTIFPSWGPSGSNTLRANNINWSRDQANGGMVCLQMKKPRTTLDDLCIGGAGQCFVSVYSSSNSCCPVFRTARTPYVAVGRHRRQQ